MYGPSGLPYKYILDLRNNIFDLALTEAATGSILQKKCALKFHKINSKTPMLESLFNNFIKKRQKSTQKDPFADVFQNKCS